MGMSLLHLVTPKANQVRWREGHFIWSRQRLNYWVLWRPHTLSHSWLSKQTRPATQYHKRGWSHTVWIYNILTWIGSSAIGNYSWALMMQKRHWANTATKCNEWPIRCWLAAGTLLWMYIFSQRRKNSDKKAFWLLPFCRHAITIQI